LDYSPAQDANLHEWTQASIIAGSGMYISDVASPICVSRSSRSWHSGAVADLSLLPIGCAKRSSATRHPHRTLEEMVQEKAIRQLQVSRREKLQSFMAKMSILRKEYGF
jgi:hypothetical protein